MSERPAMSRPGPRPWCLLGALLAVLLGCLAPVAGAGTEAVMAPAAAAATVAPAPAAPAAVASYEGLAAAFEAAPADRAPSCAPGAPDHGGVPAAPPRASGDHGYPPAARCLPEPAGPAGGAPVRVLVRGPDRAAPGPLELSVMRV
ncbi:hypothetical protein ABT084_26835 [Streptomyces sp. NPDC002138]|uniref:hypothetical protein n=1 Tax=Streptomyces sp. NPDC002138 TaxID=3154410 RepID=UPI00331F99ED